VNIIKSIFVDYCKYPKLARWKINNPKVYKKIRKIETEEQEENIMAIGQSVEDKANSLLDAVAIYPTVYIYNYLLKVL